MSVSLPDGYLNAVVIVQYENGFLVQKATPDSITSTEVFPDSDIAALAYSVLEGHTRGKRKGGLEIRFFETGTEEDKEFHDDKESTFYELNKPINIYLTPERKVTVIKNTSNKRGLQVLEAK